MNSNCEGTVLISNLIEQIRSLSVKGLKNMFDQEEQRFCYRVISKNNMTINDGISLRYTIISLLGLYRYELSGGSAPINIKTTLNSIIERREEIDNIGDLGLLFWLCALVAPDQLERIPFGDDVLELQSKYLDARQKKTTELAWFLTGLSYFALASVEKPKHLQKLGYSIYELLKQNYGGRGIFGHQANNSIAGVLRGRIGSFADQVYPIYALCRFAHAYNNKDALKIATECGETICTLQGSIGQWWWHYDSITGKVIGRYPVYSVHQHGMAPMALYELSKSTGINFDDHIAKGIHWITGKNELNLNLIDSKRNVIWRSCYQKKYRMYYEEILSLLGHNNCKNDYKNLRILYECRPYCLGWLLYAFADKQNSNT